MAETSTDGPTAEMVADGLRTELGPITVLWPDQLYVAQIDDGAGPNVAFVMAYTGEGLRSAFALHLTPEQALIVADRLRSRALGAMPAAGSA